MISFKSKIAQTVLSYFLLNQERELYVNEMAKKFKVDRGNLVKKLAEWAREGILIKSQRGNLSIYRINGNYPFLSELRSIAQKSFGIEELLRTALKKIKGIKSAIIFGSYAKNKLSAESDIDLFLIGSHNSLEALKVIVKLQKQFDREINIVDMTEREFNKRKKNKDEFISHIFADKTIKII